MFVLQVVSNVLPQFVDTKVPKDVYPTRLFISDEELQECQDACLQVLQKDYDGFEPEQTVRVENRKDSLRDLYLRFDEYMLTSDSVAFSCRLLVLVKCNRSL